MLYGLIEYYGLLDKIDPKFKRLIVAGASIVVGLLAWETAVLLGYIPAPADMTALFEGVWTYGIMTGFSAFTSSSVLHGIRNLKEPT